EAVSRKGSPDRINGFLVVLFRRSLRFREINLKIVGCRLYCERRINLTGSESFVAIRDVIVGEYRMKHEIGFELFTEALIKQIFLERRESVDTEIQDFNLQAALAQISFEQLGKRLIEIHLNTFSHRITKDCDSIGAL